MGEDGTELVSILDNVEKHGSKKYIAEDFNTLARETPKALEYGRAVKGGAGQLDLRDRARIC